MPTVANRDPGALTLLRQGKIDGMELIPWGSNYTFAVALRDDQGATALGVYKPRRGEVPLRDFPSGTLYKREVATYLLGTIMGWDLVPPTVVREDAPHGIGSLQLYVEPSREPSARFEKMRATHRWELQRMALFDLLINNADRKGGHCLLDAQGRLWGIDHGLALHHVPKLRTIIWEFCGEPVPEDLVAQLVAARHDADCEAAIRTELGALLSPVEVDALFARWDYLLANPCYPELDPYRNVPWPPY